MDGITAHSQSSLLQQYYLLLFSIFFTFYALLMPYDMHIKKAATMLRHGFSAHFSHIFLCLTSICGMYSLYEREKKIEQKTGIEVRTKRTTRKVQELFY